MRRMLLYRSYLVEFMNGCFCILALGYIHGLVEPFSHSIYELLLIDYAVTIGVEILDEFLDDSDSTVENSQFWQ